MRYGQFEGQGSQGVSQPPRQPQPLHPHQFSGVMQRILRQTDLLMQRRPALLPDAAAPASLDGLEVQESSWDEWAELTNLQNDER